jgi:hypothetical protein
MGEATQQLLVPVARSCGSCRGRSDSRQRERRATAETLLPDWPSPRSIAFFVRRSHRFHGLRCLSPFGRSRTPRGTRVPLRAERTERREALEREKETEREKSTDMLLHVPRGGVFSNPMALSLVFVATGFDDPRRSQHTDQHRCGKRAHDITRSESTRPYQTFLPSVCVLWGPREHGGGTSMQPPCSGVF